MLSTTRSAARLLLLASFAALGLCSLVAGQPLLGIIPPFIDQGSGVWHHVSGGALLTLAGLVAIAPHPERAGVLLACLWGAVAAAGVAALVVEGRANLPSFVPLADALVFALASASIALAGIARSVSLRFGLGACLSLFGFVHLAHHAAISDMIPSWLPLRAEWPWATGAILIGAGISLLAGRGARYAALAIAFMFACWLPIVHAPRLAGSPLDAEEWSFALTALALIGSVLLATARSSVSPSLTHNSITNLARASTKLQ